jgi:hypothetical protein
MGSGENLLGGQTSPRGRAGGEGPATHVTVAIDRVVGTRVFGILVHRSRLGLSLAGQPPVGRVMINGRAMVLHLGFLGELTQAE